MLAAGALRNAFLDWRRAQITRLVSAVHAEVKAIKPSVQVSAAVFPDAPSAFDDVGQDWRKWITDGLVDFLCPMDYTTEMPSFTNLVAQQLAYAAGRIPIYPGIGALHTRAGRLPGAAPGDARRSYGRLHGLRTQPRRGGKPPACDPRRRHRAR